MEKTFAKIFNSSNQPELFFAPGRVNLIGEHTDHEGGFVFPCAINLGIKALASRRDDNLIRLYSMNFDEGIFTPFEIEISEIKSKSDFRSWVNYPLGVIHTLLKHGYKFGGADILYNGNLPGGAGLSSSAAIEVLTGKIFDTFYNLNIDGVRMAKFSQEAENNFVGMNCGIMDQFAVSMGRKNHAVLLNCSTLEYSYAPLELENYKIVITNSNVPHSLAGSEYNLRRQQCEGALADIQNVKNMPDGQSGISCLCDLTPDELDEFSYSVKDPVNLRRALHAVNENARAIRASKALKNGDLNLFGRLMNASHVSLRDNYEVTVPELDTLASLAWKIPGVVGSRMTGGGFGGCTVSIVEKNSVDEFINSIGSEYEKLCSRKADFYIIETSDGAKKIS